MAIEKLRELYSRIPDMQCIAGCHGCCSRVVFAKSEWEQVPHKEKDSFLCPYVCDKGCSIFEDRPFVCRILGTADHDLFSCAYGKKPEVSLSLEELKELTRLYYEIVKGEGAPICLG